MAYLLYGVGGLILLYAIVMPLVMKKRNIEKAEIAVVRRYYYSIWILGMAFVADFMDKTILKQLGANKLGFNETVWFIIIMFLASFIIDILVISAMEFKEITLPGGASFKGTEEVRQQLDEQKDLAATLAKKVQAFFECSVQLPASSGLAKDKLNNDGDIIFTEEFQKILQKYAALQEDWDLDVEVIESKDMPGKGNYGLTGDELKIFNKYMAAGNAYLFKQKDINYLIVPYNSSLVEDQFYVIMSTKNDLYNVEHVMVLMLLQAFEVQIL